jgi:flagellin
MTVINTNIKALYTQSALKQSERASQAAMEQLSTGKRINSSKDDAAGLAIAARMTQNIKGMNQSIRNSGDAISLIQVAEGATNEITAMLQRMSELAVQSSNSTYSTDQRGYLDQEFQQLKQEIVRISETHEWNGFPILNGKAGSPVGSPVTSTATRAGVDAGSIGKTLQDGDLTIVNSKGIAVAIPASLAASDTKSNTTADSSSKSGSAIAIAAAINSKIGETGVNAVAVGPVITATKTTVGSKSIQTDLWVNGTKVSLSLTAGQTSGERRQYVINSINAGTATHGVSAGDGGNGGLTLTTVDGRNLSVWYDGSSANGINGSDFGLGLNTATASNPVGITGVASASVAAQGAKETAPITFVDTNAGVPVTINGLTFTPTANITKANLATAFASLTSGMSASDAATSHASSALLGTYSGKFTEGFTTGAVSGANSDTVTATGTDDNNGNVTNIAVGTAVVASTRTTGTTSVTESSALTFPALAAGERVTINGLSFTAKAAMNATQTAAAFANINPTNVTTAVSASSMATSNPASAALGSYSGTWLAGFKTESNTNAGLTATFITANTVNAEITVSAPTNPTRGTVVPGVNVSASTAYGTVTLNSINVFTVRPGSNAYPSGSINALDSSYANFTALGFKAETVNPKNIGRLSFQVGPSPDQLIHIDLADFGQNGDITGAITSSRAPTNILTVQAANDVTQSVNKSLDMIAQTRASMGAVMNRLEHVIDNLTNVVMNSEASRSQIEDADYAKASTELARTQIMQQAATAVLAQANTSQQTVLKLLQA